MCYFIQLEDLGTDSEVLLGKLVLTKVEVLTPISVTVLCREKLNGMQNPRNVLVHF